LAVILAAYTAAQELNERSGGGWLHETRDTPILAVASLIAKHEGMCLMGWRR